MFQCFSKGNLRFLTILFLIIWYILLHISWLKETKYTLQICEEIWQDPWLVVKSCVKFKKYVEKRLIASTFIHDFIKSLTFIFISNIKFLYKNFLISCICAYHWQQFLIRFRSCIFNYHESFKFKVKSNISRIYPYK